MHCTGTLAVGRVASVKLNILKRDSQFKIINLELTFVSSSDFLESY